MPRANNRFKLTDSPLQVGIEKTLQHSPQFDDACSTGRGQVCRGDKGFKKNSRQTIKEVISGQAYALSSEWKCRKIIRCCTHLYRNLAALQGKLIFALQDKLGKLQRLSLLLRVWKTLLKNLSPSAEGAGGIKSVKVPWLCRCTWKLLKDFTRAIILKSSHISWHSRISFPEK